jgi:hypothetical protein
LIVQVFLARILVVRRWLIEHLLVLQLLRLDLLVVKRQLVGGVIDSIERRRRGACRDGDAPAELDLIAAQPSSVFLGRTQGSVLRARAPISLPACCAGGRGPPLG